MNILIVGLGYAGNRFLNAFSELDRSVWGDEPLHVAYHSRSRKRSDLPYYADLQTALQEFDPAIVVISVNDEFHMEIIQELGGYKGFVICEKPLVNTQDDLELLQAKLSETSGFCMDLIERYSEATIILKNYVQEQNLRLLRAHFCWGKDRINDFRPTCGVISEVIHPLDLVQWISAPEVELELQDIQGVRSDFSISGPNVLDSVALTARLDDAVVTGYSSFVNIVRRREVDFVFASPHNKLIYATMVFDTPEWDHDFLRIWEKTPDGERVIVELKTEIDSSKPGLDTIRKLIRLVHDVTGYALHGVTPSQPFADIQTSVRLQRLLNIIEQEAKTIGPVQYVVGPEREIFNDETNLERLG